jgi:hypothetical protein
MIFIDNYGYWGFILQILVILFLILTHRRVNPEAEPGDDDEHAGGNIDSEQVVGELSLQGQLHLQAAVLACNRQEELKGTQEYTRMRNFLAPILNFVLYHC